MARSRPFLSKFLKWVSGLTPLNFGKVGLKSGRLSSLRNKYKHCSIVKGLGCRGIGKSWRFDLFSCLRRKGVSFLLVQQRCIQQPRYLLQDCIVFVQAKLRVLYTKVFRFHEWVSWWEERRRVQVQNRRF